MRIFVTGGTGFIGNHFVEQALNAGHEVTALRRAGSRPRRELAAEPTWLEGEMTDDWREHLCQQDALVHLAAHTANPPYDPLPACLQWNVLAPMQLAEQARVAGVRRFIVAGSCFEYGHQTLDEIPATQALAPNNAYATSKAAASQAFIGWALEHRLQLHLMRVFHVYGEGEPEGRFWPALRRAARSGADFPMSAGEQVRDFVNVEEVARQFVAALGFDGVADGEPCVSHVGSGQAQSLLAFAQHWWAAWGAKGQLRPGQVPYRPGEVMRLVPQLKSHHIR